MNDQDLLNWFTYHHPTPEQILAYEAIRQSALVFAKDILRYTHSSADQTTAIRKLREAVMTANAAIACGGR